MFCSLVRNCFIICKSSLLWKPSCCRHWRFCNIHYPLESPDLLDSFWLLKYAGYCPNYQSSSCDGAGLYRLIALESYWVLSGYSSMHVTSITIRIVGCAGLYRLIAHESLKLRLGIGMLNMNNHVVDCRFLNLINSSRGVVALGGRVAPVFLNSECW